VLNYKKLKIERH